MWRLYKSGRGNLAAYPGTSVHGEGRAIDLASPAMRRYIDAHGAQFGWHWGAVQSEWWHIQFYG